MELESQVDAFRKEGLNVAALSYDPPGLLEDFAAKRGISYPLLSDRDSRYIRALGLLNDIDYPLGHFAHGVPYPGVLVTDATGRVTRRFFETVYEERRTGGSILAAIGGAPPSTAGRLAVDTPQVRVRVAMSNGSARPGQRISLLLDFELPPGMHAYAPGARGYRPLALNLEANPLITLHDWVLPPSTPYTFAPLNETVPVFTGNFRAIQDVTLQGPKPLQELLKTESPGLEIRGALTYQICSDTVCYAPQRAPVSWRVEVAGLDVARTPEALRKK